MVEIMLWTGLGSLELKIMFENRLANKIHHHSDSVLEAATDTNLVWRRRLAASARTVLARSDAVAALFMADAFRTEEEDVDGEVWAAARMLSSATT